MAVWGARCLVGLVLLGSASAFSPQIQLPRTLRSSAASCRAQGVLSLKASEEAESSFRLPLDRRAFLNIGASAAILSQVQPANAEDDAAKKVADALPRIWPGVAEDLSVAVFNDGSKVAKAAAKGAQDCGAQVTVIGTKLSLDKQREAYYDGNCIAAIIPNFEMTKTLMKSKGGLVCRSCGISGDGIGPYFIVVLDGKGQSGKELGSAPELTGKNCGPAPDGTEVCFQDGPAIDVFTLDELPKLDCKKNGSGINCAVPKA